MTVATGPPRPLGDPADYTLSNNKTGTPQQRAASAGRLRRHFGRAPPLAAARRRSRRSSTRPAHPARLPPLLAIAGTWFTGAMHSLNAIVGAGVLSLPWAVAQLGWVAGPLLLLAFFLISRWASILLVELYVVDGLEHARYSHAGEQGSDSRPPRPCSERAATGGGWAAKRAALLS